MRTISRLPLLAFALLAVARQSTAQNGPDLQATNWHPALPAGFQSAWMFDRYLGMNAYLVQYPKAWHLQSIVHQGSPCFSTPSPVFRATSGDGLSMIESFPPLAWAWGGRDQGHVKPGCLPLDDGMSAQDFLKALSAELKVEYVADVKVPDSVMAAFQRDNERGDAFWVNKYRAAGMMAPDYFHDLALANVRFTNGSFKMRGRLRASVDCIRNWGTNAYGQKVWNANCRAFVRYFTAPEQKLDELLALARSTWAYENPQYENAVIQRDNERTAMMLQVMNQEANAAIANMTAQHQILMSQMDAQQKQHEEFLATLQQGTDNSMRNAAAIADAQHTITSDWVDMLLGQQTVKDPTTGETAKVESGYNYTWRNTGTNATFQTADPNADPNGSGNGSWVLTQQVHGTGKP
jgi:hypothetical protein